MARKTDISASQALLPYQPMILVICLNANKITRSKTKRSSMINNNNNNNNNNINNNNNNNYNNNKNKKNSRDFEKVLEH